MNFNSFLNRTNHKNNEQEEITHTNKSNKKSGRERMKVEGNLSKRVMSFVLALIMVLGTFGPLATMEVKAQGEEEVPTEPYNVVNHPEHAVIDEANTGNFKTNWNNVKHPIVDDFYVGDTKVTGKADPGARVYYGDTSVEATDGTFEIAISEAQTGVAVELYAELDGKKSPTTSAYPLRTNEPKGRHRKSIVLTGTSFINKGISKDDKGYYFEMTLDTQLLTEAYLNFIDGKIYYQFSSGLDKYISSIEMDRGGNVATRVPSNENTELPGTNLWVSGIMGTQNGPIRAALAGQNTTTYKIYLANVDESGSIIPDSKPPLEVLKGEYAVKIWGRYRDKKGKKGDIVSNLERNAVLFYLDKEVYSPNKYFNASDGWGNPGPVVDTATFDYDNNRIILGYRLNYNGKLPTDTKYDLHIDLPNSLKNLVGSVSHGPLGKENEITGNVNINTDNSGKIIIPDIFTQGVFKENNTFNNRQDRNIYLNIKDGHNLSEALGSQYNRYDISLYVKDRLTYVDVKAKVEDLVKKIPVQNFDKGAIASSNFVKMNLKDAKDKLTDFINEKHNAGSAAHNPNIVVDEELYQNISSLNLKQILDKVAANPHPLNIDLAQQELASRSDKDLGGGSIPAGANRTRIEKFFNAAREVYNFVNSDLYEGSNPGMIYKNTLGTTYIEAIIMIKMD